MQAVLDVLIEMRMPVPWEDLEQWFRNFPDEVIVLMARNPAANEAPLLDWFDEDIPHSRWLAIGDLLAEHRTPGFALRLLRDLEVTVAVTVGSGFGAGSGGGMSACGGCRPLAPLPGYPPIGYYKLMRQLIPGSALVAAGPTPIYVERGITSQHHVCWASGEPGADRNEYRLDYLAALLYVPRDKLPFGAKSNYSLPWLDEEQFSSDMQAIVADQKAQFGLLLRKLQDAGLLEAAEAAGLQPDLRFDVNHLRDDKSALLVVPQF